MMVRFIPVIFIAVVFGLLGLVTLDKKGDQDNPFVSKLIGEEIPQDPESILAEKLFDTDKVTIVNFFASWCVPCRVEHPQLMGLQKNKDIQIIGVAFKDKQENIDAFLNELGDPFDIVLQDKDGTVAVTWGIHGAPESFVIDKNNIIRYNHAGPIMDRDLISFVTQIERYK